ncbi:MAG: hypothetical protein ACTSSI_08100, partial [Candidatus Helarchaeota archaeon]
MVVYPITGPFQEILISLELIIMAVFLEIAVFFFVKYINNRRKGVPSIIELDWGILFLCFGIGYIWFLFGDYTTLPRPFFITLAYISITLGGLLFSLQLESTRTLNTHYGFTAFVSVTLIFIIITAIFIPSLEQIFASLSIIPAYLLLAVYFFKIAKKIWTRYKIEAIGLLCGIFLTFAGYASTSDMIVNLVGLQARILGDIVMLGGMILIAFFLNGIPSLSEIGWEDKLMYIIITTHSGILLYSKNFHPRGGIDTAIFAGALTMLTELIQKTTRSDEALKIISKKNYVFMLEKGEKILGILVVKQELEILKYFLKELVVKFESFFQKNLQDWSGNIEIFRPTNYIIEEVF